MKARFRKFVGEMIWYFIEPIVNEWGYKLVDEDQLNAEISAVQHDVDMVQSDCDALRQEVEAL